MADPRIEKLAEILVRYSLGVKKGEWVRIEGSVLGEELMRAAMVEVLRAGGHPSLHPRLEGEARLLCEHGTREQLEFIPPVTRVATDRADCLLTFWGGANTREMTGVDPTRLALVRRSRKPIFDRMLKRISERSLRWVGTEFPTQAAAQDAEMALEDYQEFVFRAGLLHKRDPIAEWKKVSKLQARTARFLSTLSEIHIKGPDTDLKFGVKGRRWVNCDGRQNFPDGEIFTGPLETATEGFVRYNLPAVYGGREVEGVRLVFRRGRVVEATADKGQDYLRAMLDMDRGARVVGELAFGTNYSIKRFTRNTLFDEKIGGTVHIAVGASLPESGGRNKSALHWDMVLDTRRGFVISGDGRPMHRNGKFLRP